MGKCSSKEKRGRKLVSDKNNKGGQASVSSSASSSPRDSQSEAPGSAQAAPLKIVEATQAVPTPTVSPAKLKEARKSLTQPIAISTKVEDPAETTTSQSLEEPELFFGEEIQMTSSSAPAGLRQRNVTNKKEGDQPHNPAPDTRSESFHDAIDDLPDFPVLDSSFDESEFRTPIGRLSTDSSYSSDKSSSFSERDRAVTSHYGFSPKTIENMAEKQGATTRQQLDNLSSSREEKRKERQLAKGQSSEGTYQIDLLSASKSQASNQETTVGQIGVVLPIHTRDEHFAAPKGNKVIVQAKPPPTEAGEVSSLLQNAEPQQLHNPKEAPKDMDDVSPTESFEHIEASDAYVSEDDMQPRKSDSSYVMLGSEKAETTTKDSSPCSLEAVMIEKPEGFIDHLEPSQPSKEEPSKEQESSYECVTKTASDKANEEKNESEILLTKSPPEEYETSEKSPISSGFAPAKAASMEEDKTDKIPTVIEQDCRMDEPKKSKTKDYQQAWEQVSVAQIPQWAQDAGSHTADDDIGEPRNKEVHKAGDKYKLEKYVPEEKFGEFIMLEKVANLKNREIVEKLKTQEPEHRELGEAVQDDAMQQPERSTLQEDVGIKKVPWQESTPTLEDQTKPCSEADEQENKEKEDKNLDYVPDIKRKEAMEEMAAKEAVHSKDQNNAKLTVAEELHDAEQKPHQLALEPVQSSIPLESIEIQPASKEQPATNIGDHKKEDSKPIPVDEVSHLATGHIQKETGPEAFIFLQPKMETTPEGKQQDQGIHQEEFDPVSEEHQAAQAHLVQHVDELKEREVALLKLIPVEDEKLQDKISPTGEQELQDYTAPSDQCVSSTIVMAVDGKKNPVESKEMVSKSDQVTYEPNEPHTPGEQSGTDMNDQREKTPEMPNLNERKEIISKMSAPGTKETDEPRLEHITQERMLEEKKDENVSEEDRQIWGLVLDPDGSLDSMANYEHRDDHDTPPIVGKEAEQEVIPTSQQIHLAQPQGETPTHVIATDEHENDLQEPETVVGDSFQTVATSPQDGSELMHNTPTDSQEKASLDVTATDEHENKLPKTEVRELKEKPSQESDHEEPSLASEEAEPAAETVEKPDTQSAEEKAREPFTPEGEIKDTETIEKPDTRSAEEKTTELFTPEENIKGGKDQDDMPEVLEKDSDEGTHSDPIATLPCQGQESLKVAIESQETACEEKPHLAAETTENLNLQSAEEKPTEPDGSLDSMSIHEHRNDLDPPIVKKQPEQEAIPTSQQIHLAQPRGETPSHATATEEHESDLQEPETHTESVLVDKMPKVAIESEDDVKNEDIWARRARKQELSEKTFPDEPIPATEMSIQPATDSKTSQDTKAGAHEEVEAGEALENQRDITVELQKDLREASEGAPCTCINNNKDGLAESQFEGQLDKKGVSQREELPEVAKNLHGAAYEGKSGLAAETVEKPDTQSAEEKAREPFTPEGEIKDTETIEKPDTRSAEEKTTELFTPEENIKGGEDQYDMPEVLEKDSDEGTHSDPVATLPCQGQESLKVAIESQETACEEKPHLAAETTENLNLQSAERKPTEPDSSLDSMSIHEHRNDLDPPIVEKQPEQEAIPTSQQIHLAQPQGEVPSHATATDEHENDLQEPEGKLTKHFIPEEEVKDGEDQHGMPHVLKKDMPGEGTDSDTLTTLPSIQGIFVNAPMPCVQSDEERNVKEAAELEEQLLPETSSQPSPPMHIEEKSDAAKASDFQENGVTGDGLETPKDVGDGSNEKETSSTCIDENEHDTAEPQPAQQPDQEKLPIQDMLGVPIESLEGTLEGESSLSTKDSEKQAKAEPDKKQQRTIDIEEQEEQGDMADLYKIKALHTAAEAEVTTTESFSPRVLIDIEEPCAVEEKHSEGDVKEELEEKALERGSLDAVGVNMLPCTDDQAKLDNKETSEEVKACDIQDNKGTDKIVEPRDGGGNKKEDTDMTVVPRDGGGNKKKEVAPCIDEHKHTPLETRMEVKPEKGSVVNVLEAPIGPQDVTVEGESSPKPGDTKKLSTELEDTEHLKDSEEQCDIPHIPKKVVPDAEAELEEITAPLPTEATEAPVRIQQLCAEEEHDNVPQMEEKPEKESVIDVPESPIEPQHVPTEGKSSPKLGDMTKLSTEPEETEPLIDSEENCDMPYIPNKVVPDADAELEALRDSLPTEASSPKPGDVKKLSTKPEETEHLKVVPDAKAAEAELEAITDSLPTEAPVHIQQSCGQEEHDTVPDTEENLEKKSVIDVLESPKQLQHVPTEEKSSPKPEDVKNLSTKPEETEPQVDSKEQYDMPHVSNKVPDIRTELEAIADSRPTAAPVHIQEPCAKEERGNVPEIQWDVAPELQDKVPILAAELPRQPSSSDQIIVDRDETSEEGEIRAQKGREQGSYSRDEGLEVVGQQKATATEGESSPEAQDIKNPESPSATRKQEETFIQVQQSVDQSEEQCNVPPVSKQDDPNAGREAQTETPETLSPRVSPKTELPCAQEEDCNAQVTEVDVPKELQEKFVAGRSTCRDGIEMQPQDSPSEGEPALSLEEIGKQAKVESEEKEQGPIEVEQKEHGERTEMEALQTAPEAEMITTESFSPRVLVDIQEPCAQEKHSKGDVQEHLEEKTLQGKSLEAAGLAKLPSLGAKKMDKKVAETDKRQENEVTDKALERYKDAGNETNENETSSPCTNENAYDPLETQAEQPDQVSVYMEKGELGVFIEPQDGPSQGEPALSPNDTDEKVKAESEEKEQELIGNEEQKEHDDMTDLHKMEATEKAPEAEMATTESFSPRVPLDIQEPCAQEKNLEGDAEEGLKEEALQGKSLEAAGLTKLSSTDVQAMDGKEAKANEFQENQVTEKELEPPEDAGNETNANETNSTFTNENERDPVLGVSIEPQDGPSQGEPALSPNDTDKKVKAESEEKEQELKDNEEQKEHCETTDLQKTEALQTAPEAEMTTTESFSPRVSVDTQEPCAQEKHSEGDVQIELDKKALRGESLEAAGLSKLPSIGDQAMEGKESKTDYFRENEVTDKGIEPPKDAGNETNAEDTEPPTCNNENEHDPLETRAQKQLDQESTYIEKGVLGVSTEPQDGPSQREPALSPNDTDKQAKAESEEKEHDLINKKEQAEHGSIGGFHRTEASHKGAKTEVTPTESISPRFPVDREESCAQEKHSEEDVQVELEEKASRWGFLLAEPSKLSSTGDQAIEEKPDQKNIFMEKGVLGVSIEPQDGPSHGELALSPKNADQQAKAESEEKEQELIYNEEQKEYGNMTDFHKTEPLHKDTETEVTPTESFSPRVPVDVYEPCAQDKHLEDLHVELGEKALQGESLEASGITTLPFADDQAMDAKQVIEVKEPRDAGVRISEEEVPSIYDHKNDSSELGIEEKPDQESVILEKEVLEVPTDTCMDEQCSPKPEDMKEPSIEPEEAAPQLHTDVPLDIPTKGQCSPISGNMKKFKTESEEAEPLKDSEEQCDMPQISTEVIPDAEAEVKTITGSQPLEAAVHTEETCSEEGHNNVHEVQDGMAPEMHEETASIDEHMQSPLEPPSVEQQNERSVSLAEEPQEVAIDPQTIAHEGEFNQAAEDTKKPEVQNPERDPAEPLIEEQELTDKGQHNMSASEIDKLTTGSSNQRLPVDMKEQCAQEEESNVQETPGDVAKEMPSLDAKMAMQPSTDDKALMDSRDVTMEVHGGDNQENNVTEDVVDDLEVKETRVKFVPAAMHPINNYQQSTDIEDTSEEIKANDVQRKEVTNMEMEPPKGIYEATNESTPIGIDGNEDGLQETQTAKISDESQEVEELERAREPQAADCEGYPSLAAADVKKSDFQPTEREPTEPCTQVPKALSSEKTCKEPDTSKLETPDVATGDKALITESLNQEVPYAIQEPCSQQDGSDVPKTDAELPAYLQERAIEGESFQIDETGMQPSTAAQAVKDIKEPNAEVQAGDLKEQVKGLVIEPAMTGEEPNEKKTNTGDCGIDNNKGDLEDTRLREKLDQESIGKGKDSLKLASQERACEEKSGLAAELIGNFDPQSAEEKTQEPFMLKEERKNGKDQCDMPLVLKSPDDITEANKISTPPLTQGMLVDTVMPFAHNNVQEREVKVAAEPQ
ncbi:hypothetical protein L7F22_055560 [Adiantum nelumboides]|nr:hypothetical protein [Adiantum nelumboides]